MNIEAGMIGYLLTHEEEIENARMSVTPDMIDNPDLRLIYSSMLKGNTSIVPLSEAVGKSVDDFDGIVRYCINNHTPGEPLKNYVVAIRRHDRKKRVEDLISKYKDGFTDSEIDAQLEALLDNLTELKPKRKSKGITAQDLSKLIDDYFKPHEKGFEFGFPELDRCTGGIDKGDVCVIAARPAVGKTAFAMNVILNNKDLKCGYFNMEMSNNQIFERWASAESGIDMQHLRKADRANNDEQERLQKASDKMKEYNIVFYTSPKSLKFIYEECKLNDFDYIIIDYLQLIVSDERRRSSRTEEVGDISRGLKSIATKFHIPVIALSQLNRKSESTSDKEPSMAEIRESGAIEQDASVIVILWSHEEDGKRNIKVEKARMGIPGKTELYFDGAHMKFSEKPMRYFREMRREDEVPFT